MKRYVKSMILVLLFSCGMYTDFAFGLIRISPTTDREDSIVNAIKYYSNLTEADVNQYKLVWYRGLGTFGAFLAGAASTIGAGAGVYQKITPEISEQIKSWTPETIASIKDWISSPIVLAGLGAASAGYASYRILYPRIRAGVLNKVQKVIDVCEGLRAQTCEGNENPDCLKYTIVNFNFGNLDELATKYLPNDWKTATRYAVYSALCNLADQAHYADLLLNDIKLYKNDAEIIEKSELVTGFHTALSYNAILYSYSVPPKKHNKNYSPYSDIESIQKGLESTEKQQEAQYNATQAQTGVAKAGTYALYGSMFKGAVSGVWNGIKELYAHPEILGLLGLGWVTTKYLVPSIKGVSKGTWDTLKSLKQ